MAKEPKWADWFLTPWTVFRAALKAVPALKYAFAVLGIVSALAIVKSFGIDFRVAAAGTIVMLVLMVASFVFAVLTQVGSPQIQAAALVLMWAYLALAILSATLLFTSAFFDYPKPLPQLGGFSDGPNEPKRDPRIIPDRGSIISKPPTGTPDVNIENIEQPDEGALVPPGR